MVNQGKKSLYTPAIYCIIMVTEVVWRESSDAEKLEGDGARAPGYPGSECNRSRDGLGKHPVGAAVIRTRTPLIDSEIYSAGLPCARQSR